MLIKKYNLFLEARLADLLKVKGQSELADKISKAKDEEFDLTAKLPKEVILDNKSKLRLSYYNTAIHNLVKRLKDRTSFASVDHFVEVLKEKFCDIFPYKVGKELFRTGRYTIYLTEYNLSIIVEFDLNKNLKDSYFLSIITVLGGKKGDNIVDFIEI